MILSFGRAARGWRIIRDGEKPKRKPARRAAAFGRRASNRAGHPIDVSLPPRVAFGSDVLFVATRPASNRRAGRAFAWPAR